MGRRLLIATAVVSLTTLAVVSSGGASRQVVSFHSVALRGAVHATVVLPPDYGAGGGRYPVVYFLHGLPAAPTAYQGSGWLQDTLARIGAHAILVEPQGARSGDPDPEYIDWGPGRNWETYVSRELPAYVDAHFRTIPTRAGRALVGLSAGGYGAVELGFNHLDRFSVIESWSGYFHATDPTGQKALAAPPRTNVHTLIGRFRSYQKLHPTFFAFYVGAGDTRFRAENVQLDRELDAAGVPHRFAVVRGGHESSVWQAHADVWLRLALSRLAPEQP